ncbi:MULTISPECIES: methyltransferase domain-containing protein [unclassified Agarivorans]|uniref:methyltransferase domain-containing protein n=1 Tax=unclassified Agarivorans TaxID=2636026 RepID=UPI0026E25B45|nr:MULTISPECIES: methyltransferase domain-containing protein [unclassified Agarivorans]MDO6685640.1 methyltransferase domain-containing protein [Agarivorans sp. 3_MG-2023]MDO6716245.1 methyltransferase domain-containing protein [Agarivorans sp. 2_MG-2023]
MKCPLCCATSPSDFYRNKCSQYWHCPSCDLIFLDPNDLLSADAEKAHYDCHNNDPQDQAYLGFLRQVSEPVVAALTHQAIGLDFGCGPGPALALLLEQAGHQLLNYDPIYYPDEQLLTQTYRFVTSSEVVEHFNFPEQAWQRLISLVQQPGLLAVMTKRHSGTKVFPQWYYKNDPTHVAFYSDKTFAWLAEHYQMKLEIVSPSVALFHRV